MNSTDGSREDTPMACSFCGKTAPEVGQMIRGKSANICDECIKHLHETEILDRKQEQMLDSTDDA